MPASADSVSRGAASTVAPVATHIMHTVRMVTRAILLDYYPGPCMPVSVKQCTAATPSAARAWVTTCHRTGSTSSKMGFKQQQDEVSLAARWGSTSRIASCQSCYLPLCCHDWLLTCQETHLTVFICVTVHVVLLLCHPCYSRIVRRLHGPNTSAPATAARARQHDRLSTPPATAQAAAAPAAAQHHLAAAATAAATTARPVMCLMH